MRTFKLIIGALSLVLVALGCTRINQKSRDYYEGKNLRHGVVPITGGVVKKLENASVERGRAIYQTQCMSCHGKDGDGNGAAAPAGSKPMNLRKLANEVQDFKFFLSVSQWNGSMPGWNEPISAADRDDLTSYIKSLRSR